MKTKLYFLVLLGVFLLNSCSPKYSYEAEQNTREMRNIVIHQNNLLEQFFKGGDAEKLAAMYTENATLSPDRGPFVRGRVNIKKFWANDFKNSKLVDMKTEVFTTAGTEEMIYETGKTTTKSLYKDSIYTFKVKYINVWRRQADGQYLLDIDFWNSEE